MSLIETNAVGYRIEQCPSHYKIPKSELTKFRFHFQSQVPYHTLSYERVVSCSEAHHEHHSPEPGAGTHNMNPSYPIFLHFRKRSYTGTAGGAKSLSQEWLHSMIGTGM
jgi:hypothetical protein